MVHTYREQSDPNGQIFTLWAISYSGQLFLNFRVLPNIWDTFFLGESYVLILTKIDWATFLGYFLQTYLVTLTKKFLYSSLPPLL
jgi:hypothetical protein